MKPFTTLAVVCLTVSLAGCGGGYSSPTYDNNNGGGGGGGNLPNNIDVLDNQFGPDSLNVAAGTTVTWTWGGYATHNVTFSNVNVGNSGDMMTGSFQKTFDTAGEYDFHCTHHVGMVGKVVVH